MRFFLTLLLTSVSAELTLTPQKQDPKSLLPASAKPSALVLYIDSSGTLHMEDEIPGYEVPPPCTGDQMVYDLRNSAMLACGDNGWFRLDPVGDVLIIRGTYERRRLVPEPVLGGEGVG